ncbi:MAG: outer membrane assembly lipoprotein Yfgl [uncultured bacterium]|nr:MAG: outer membrane assembly lipoprotein Yfgl [uncultured bacterium]
MKKITRLFIATAITLALSACSFFTDKDNTPSPAKLVDFTPEINVHPVWYTRTGRGSNSDYIKLSPAISGTAVFTASKNGTVAANDKITGKSLWQVNTSATISGGTATSDDLVYVGTENGYTLALHQTNGQTAWKAASSSEILAQAATSQGVTLVKSIDGRVTAFATHSGQPLWHYQQIEPNLILRGSSAPQISRESVVVGFENGNLTKLSLQQGRVQWEKTIAEPEGIFAIQRMVDIDADPLVQGNRIYAATYQGRIAALDFVTGQTLWTHDISSYTGIAADTIQVYVSDARSRVWAFNTRNGTVNWQQNSLAARNITGPALFDHYLVVGDAEGYLHWMSKQDGHFVARTFVNRSGILATPIVDNNRLYVYTKDGHLATYTIG